MSALQRIKDHLKLKSLYDDNVYSNFKREIDTLLGEFKYSEIPKWTEYNKSTSTNTADDLAGTELSVLLHWFLAVLGSELVTKEIPYSSLFSDVNNIDDTNLSEQKNVNIGLLSDWASCTSESYNVAKNAFAQNNDYNIHMGDVYFTGTINECYKNFCGCDDGVQFPFGNKGIRVLGGNHECYSNYIGFKNVLMPFAKQQSPIWSIECDQWIILGIDTGFHSVNLEDWNPNDNTEAANLNLQLQDVVVKWLQKYKDTKKGIILLSHHYPTTFDDSVPLFDKVLNIISDIFVNKNVIWFFGHSHVLTLYKLQNMAKFQYYGRCIGNGGFPVQNGNILDEVTKYKDYISVVDCVPGANSKYGRNGWCTLNICDDTCNINYYVLDNDNTTKNIITETFTVNNNGVVTNTNLTIYDQSLTVYNSTDNNKSVGRLIRKTNSKSCCNVM